MIRDLRTICLVWRRVRDLIDPACEGRRTRACERCLKLEGAFEGAYSSQYVVDTNVGAVTYQK